MQSAVDIEKTNTNESDMSPRISLDHPSPGGCSVLSDIISIPQGYSIDISHSLKDLSSMEYDILASPAAPSLREFGPQQADHAMPASRSSMILADKHLSSISVLSASSPVISSNPTEVQRILKLYGIQSSKVEQESTSVVPASAPASAPASPTNSLHDQIQIDLKEIENEESPYVRVRGVKSSFSSFVRGTDSATSARGLPLPQRNNGKKSPAIGSPSSVEGSEETTAATNCILSNFYDFDNGQCGYDKCDCGDWAAFMSRTIAEMSQPDYSNTESSFVPTPPRKTRKSKPAPLDLSRISAKLEKQDRKKQQQKQQQQQAQAQAQHASNNSISSRRSKTSSTDSKTKSRKPSDGKADSVFEIGKNIKSALGERSNTIDLSQSDSKFIKYDLTPSPNMSAYPLHPLTIELAKRDLGPKHEPLDDRNQGTFFTPSTVKKAMLRPIKSFKKLRIVA